MNKDLEKANMTTTVVTLVASDGVHETMTDVTLTVGLVNQFSPNISAPDSVDILENATDGTLVLKVFHFLCFLTVHLINYICFCHVTLLSVVVSAIQ